MDSERGITMSEFKTVVEDFKGELKKVVEVVNHGFKKIDVLQEQVGCLMEGQTELRLGQKSLENRMDKLENGQARLEKDVTDLKAGQARLEKDVTGLKAGQAKLETRQGKLEIGQSKLVVGQARLEKGQAEIKAELKHKVSVREFAVMKKSIGKIKH